MMKKSHREFDKSDLRTIRENTFKTFQGERDILEEVFEESGAGVKATQAVCQESPDALRSVQVLVLPGLVHALAQNLVSQTIRGQTLGSKYKTNKTNNVWYISI